MPAAFQPTKQSAPAELQLAWRGNGIVVLGHDTCVLDVEVAVELAVAFFMRLLVLVDLIAEYEAERSRTVSLVR